jgi:glycosyltransferase involved in cell wall biosynthesis
MAEYPIIHLDLSTKVLPEVILSHASAGLIVLWWHDCPVGEVGHGGRSVDLQKIALAAAAPEDLNRGKQIVDHERVACLARPSMPTTTVIICTKDRPNSLARCLASLPKQTLVPNQIVVVDNGSADARTREVAAAAGVEYVREDKPGLDSARNAGLRVARGEIIAYTDDDVQLHVRWLERLVGAFDQPEVMAVTGLVLPAELETAAQRHFETYWKFGRGYRRLDFGPNFFAADRRYGCPAWEIGAGANMAFRRETFAAAGPFDERLDVGAAGCSGDSEYWHRVLSRGWTCRYEPSAVVYHYHRKDFDGLSSQIFHYMRGHAAALLVQFERSGNYGNLRRAFVSMPFWYARRIVQRVLQGFSERDRFLWQEITGYISGIIFYLRNSRSSGVWGSKWTF